MPTLPVEEKLNELKSRVRQLRAAGVRAPQATAKRRVRRLPKKAQDLHHHHHHPLAPDALPQLKHTPTIATPTVSAIPVKPVATTELSHNTTTHEDKSKPPFNEEEYERMKQAFEELDIDGGGDLTMKEISRIPDIIGRKDLVIDRTLFKKMDKDRSGTVDFIEMLRCLYPTHPANSIRAAVAKYSAPNEIARRRKKADKDETKDWRVTFKPETVLELLSIFQLYGEEVTPGVMGITKASLRNHVTSASVGDDTLDEIFEQYATRSGGSTATDTAKPTDDPTAKSDVDEEDVREEGEGEGGGGGGGPDGDAALLGPVVAVLSGGGSGVVSDVAHPHPHPHASKKPYIGIDAFASIMELTYTADEKSSKAPQLYFQKKSADGPTYPLSLPRV